MKLSVIVPVYNIKQYLERCIDSILEQTFVEYELILVDDGSTDGSGELCEDYKKIDNRIKVIHKKNGGLSSARNAGLKVANGDFISFIDGDDYIENRMYEVMVDAAERTKKDIVVCGRITHLNDNWQKVDFNVSNEVIYSRKEAIKEILLMENIDVSACDKIFRRELFEKIRYPEGEINEDAAIIFELLKSANGIVQVGTPFYHYVYRGNSISKSKYTHRFYVAYLNCIKAQKQIVDEYPDLLGLSKIYCTKVCGALLQSISEDKELMKKYKNDYKTYKQLFNKGFGLLLIESKTNIKAKIKYIFVYFNLFWLFLEVKKSINSVKR